MLDFHIDIDLKLFFKVHFKYFPRVKNFRISQNLTHLQTEPAQTHSKNPLLYYPCEMLLPWLRLVQFVNVSTELGFALMHEQHCQSADVFRFIAPESRTYHLSFELFRRVTKVEIYFE